MNAAKIENSPPLRRMHELLKDGQPVSGFVLMMAAPTTGLSARVSELRANGLDIVCERRYNKTKKRQDHFYRLRA